MAKKNCIPSLNLNLSHNLLLFNNHIQRQMLLPLQAKQPTMERSLHGNNNNNNNNNNSRDLSSLLVLALLKRLWLQQRLSWMVMAKDSRSLEQIQPQILEVFLGLLVRVVIWMKDQRTHLLRPNDLRSPHITLRITKATADTLRSHLYRLQLLKRAIPNQADRNSPCHWSNNRQPPKRPQLNKVQGDESVWNTSTSLLCLVRVTSVRSCWQRPKQRRNSTRSRC